MMSLSTLKLPCLLTDCLNYIKKATFLSFYELYATCSNKYTLLNSNPPNCYKSSIKQVTMSCCIKLLSSVCHTHVSITQNRFDDLVVIHVVHASIVGVLKFNSDRYE